MLYNFQWNNKKKKKKKKKNKKKKKDQKKKKNKKNKKNKKKDPPPKYIGRMSASRLKFDTKTTHVLLAEFRGLGVRMIHVTRRTRSPPKKF